MTTMAAVPRVKGYLIQFLMLLAINVPTISFGLAMGWVSLASGEGTEGEAGGEAALVGAAAATFAAGAAGVPLAARALRHGRKPALIATSAAFAVCWSLKLCGGWCVVVGRVAAGVAGAGAWVVVPLLATEMCSGRVRGAGVAALGLAHNLGVLLMYVAAAAGLRHRTVLLWCLGLSVVHGCLFLFAPESPAFLAAQGKDKEARSSLAWLRGVAVDHPSLSTELRDLPPHDTQHSPWTRLKEMLSDRRRRRAFWIVLIALVGQESCGVLTLMQFAERVFMLTRDEPEADGGEVELLSPARHAVVLGAVQLVASAMALYLVERVGRRPLLVWGAVGCGASLACGAGAAHAGWSGACAGALAAAVAADSLGLQPAPYALLGDMFDYKYSESAVLAVMLAACAGNAAETVAFPSAAAGAGLPAALALAAAATLALALFALVAVPETRGRTPEQIYDIICPPKDQDPKEKKPYYGKICTDKCGVRQGISPDDNIYAISYAAGITRRDENNARHFQRLNGACSNDDAKNFRAGNTSAAGVTIVDRNDAGLIIKNTERKDSDVVSFGLTNVTLGHSNE